MDGMFEFLVFLTSFFLDKLFFKIGLLNQAEYLKAFLVMQGRLLLLKKIKAAN
jgi:hypothetical protein